MITYDPRAMEAKRKAAEERAKRDLVRPAPRLHPTDYCAIVGAVGLVAFVATFALTGGF